ncbi:hypothetical protein [Nostoc sp. 'Peltigera malacea cyanobiont' DB3992]|uniref:hypothetical protein n=1 Tax=Nostoc sp. 'Peltigera malacea cyanobiont' DB3992 TaxID=1206980 RepID=UPI0015D4F46A|nr:hypothetical protein [Nostoc sp. 'Peltigera malacea cyanobiont' DB3992]
MAGETVVLWWGLFDNELYVEFSDRRYGPFYPVDGPIPLHRYRILCVERYSLRSRNSISAFPASKTALSTLRSKCRR